MFFKSKSVSSGKETGSRQHIRYCSSDSTVKFKTVRKSSRRLRSRGPVARQENSWRQAACTLQDPVRRASSVQAARAILRKGRRRYVFAGANAGGEVLSYPESAALPKTEEMELREETAHYVLRFETLVAQCVAQVAGCCCGGCSAASKPAPGPGPGPQICSNSVDRSI